LGTAVLSTSAADPNPGAQHAPKEVFDRQWAFTLFELTMARLHAKFNTAWKAEDFAVLSSYLEPRRERIDYVTAVATPKSPESGAEGKRTWLFIFLAGTATKQTLRGFR
jgi:hypothetical protein